MTTLLIERQDGGGFRSSRETCRILRLRRLHHGKIPLGNGSHDGGIPRNTMSGEWDVFFFCQCVLNSRVSDCWNAVPTNRRRVVHGIHTHSVHDIDTVCSQARTNVNACLWLKSRWLSFIIFVRLKESIFRSAPTLVVPTLSYFQQHAALSGPRDLLQDNTVHRQPLPQEPL